MNILTIEPHWLFAWVFSGGKPECAHAYDDDAPITDTEYGGSYECVHCGALMTYDVSDIGD